MGNMDNFKTPLGDVKVEVFGHASLLFQWNDKTIYVDPYSETCDYTSKVPADLILITHNHYDHYDEKAYSKVETPSTIFVVSKNVKKADSRYHTLSNNDTLTYEGMVIKAVPAYNINRKNEKGDLFHPKGVGNGYILDFGGFRFYIAGDTEPIPEMKSLPYIDVAFLPKNLPYTMTDEEFVEVANMIKPKYLYPIHYFELDTAKLMKALDTGITMIKPNKK